MEKAEQFIGKKSFKILSSCFFVILPIIIYCIKKTNILFFITIELLSLAYIVMIITNNFNFQKKYFVRLFNLTLCSEILFLFEIFNIFSNSIIALVLALSAYTTISVLYAFLGKRTHGDG